LQLFLVSFSIFRFFFKWGPKTYVTLSWDIFETLSREDNSFLEKRRKKKIENNRSNMRVTTFFSMFGWYENSGVAIVLIIGIITVQSNTNLLFQNSENKYYSIILRER
jgi:hypothetical protein